MLYVKKRERDKMTEDKNLNKTSNVTLIKQENASKLGEKHP